LSAKISYNVDQRASLVDTANKEWKDTLSFP